MLQAEICQMFTERVEGALTLTQSEWVRRVKALDTLYGKEAVNTALFNARTVMIQALDDLSAREEEFFARIEAASHIMPGRAPCPFLSCEDKANGRPHYHYFALGETKTAYPIDGQTSIGFEEAAKLVRP